MDLPGLQHHWFALPDGPDSYPGFVAVSPGLDEIAWTSSPSEYGSGVRRQLHLTRADGDHVVARLLDEGGRCGSPDDSNRGAYSRDGSHFYSLDVPAGGLTAFDGFQGLDRVFSFRPPYAEHGVDAPAMPVWSVNGDALFYRRSGSIWRWTPAKGEQRFLDGVTWQYPTISPDGRYLAYAVPREGVQSISNHDVYLIDLQSGGSPQLIGQDRTLPVFITATQLWWRSEITDHGCAGGESQPLIYDINEAAESRSIINSVRNVWPATSSNF